MAETKYPVCVSSPPDLESIIDEHGKEIQTGLVGGWRKSTPSTADENRYKQWIKETFRMYRIYFDYKDAIRIDKVYTQVVNGINYWIWFSVNNGKEYYQAKFYESFPTGDRPPTVKVLELIACSAVVTPSYILPTTSTPYYSAQRSLRGLI